jgi:Ca-activated chloride channel homolog
MDRIILIILISLSSSLMLFSQSERKLIRNGNKAYEEKEYTEAEVFYKKAKEIQPELFQIRKNLGSALYRMDNFESSANEFTEYTVAARNDKETSEALYNLGNALLQAGEYQKSVETYKQSLRTNPDNNKARYNLQIAQEMLNKQQNGGGGGGGQQQQEQEQQQQQQEQNQDNQEEQEQEQQQAQPQEQQLSKEDAERLLQALENEEKELQEDILKEKAKAQKIIIDKNW